MASEVSPQAASMMLEISFLTTYLLRRYVGGPEVDLTHLNGWILAKFVYMTSEVVIWPRDDLGGRPQVASDDLNIA